jgi:gas vesicle structural protein
MIEYQYDENEEVTLCEAVDRILNKGAVIVGEATISVANIDLIYLALQVVLSSVETAQSIHHDTAIHTRLRGDHKS